MHSTPKTMEFAEVAIAKLCHDLSGSLGAVANALELATSDEGLAAEALALALESAREMTGRLRLVRALWDPEAAASTTEILTLARGLPGGGRLEVDGSALMQAHWPAADKQLLLAVLLLAAESLRGPGRIALAGDRLQGVLVLIEGRRAAWPDGLQAQMAQGALPAGAALDPRSLMQHLVVMLAATAEAGVCMLPAGGAPGAVSPLRLDLARSAKDS